MSVPPPGDFTFLKDMWVQEMLADAYQAITSTDMWDFMQREEPPAGEGYAWWKHPSLNTIDTAMKYQGHSGASHAITMRMMQRIAKIGWEAWVAEQLAAQKAPLQ